jgi:hypothetical protein
VRRRSSFAPAALLVAVGVAVFLLRDRSPGAPPESADRRPDLAPVAARDPIGPTLEGRPAGRGPPRDAIGGAATRDLADGFRVRGRVVGADPVPAGSIAFVTGRDGSNDEAYLARAAVGSDGSFALDARRPRDEHPWPVGVRVSLPGLREPDAHRVDVGPGQTVEVELTVPDGETAFGRVIDTDGRPVAGLRFALARGGHSVFRDHPLPERATDAVIGPWDSSVMAETTTDADGRFEVRGLPGTPHTPASYDDRWWLVVENGHTVDPGVEALLRAHAAYRLEVAVAPADPTDDPAAWGHVAVSFEIVEPLRGDGVGSGGAPNPYVLRGAVPTSGANGFAAEVSVDTLAHRRVVRRVSFGPGAWARRIDVALERFRPEETGRLVVSSSLRDAKGRPVRLTVLHHRQTGRRQWTGDWPAVETLADGRRRVVLPAGKQRVEVHADLPLKDLIAWKGVVELSPDAEAALDYPGVPTGRLLVRFPAGAVGRDVHVSFHRVDPKASASWQGRAVEEGVSFEHVPAGRLGVDVLHGGLRRMAVDVVADAVTTVDLSRAR